MSSLKSNTPFSTRYHLVHRIGVGGYSEVWLANDTLAGNMQVALKIFAPDKGLDEQGIALFSKEYALVFNLNHPNLLLPKHFDVSDGSPFLVLPYCEAGSVFSKIGNMTEADLARFLQQAASALAYLHSQDPPIIHQDIKPDNFLIDYQGNYLLSDFGISSKIRRTLTRSMGAQGSTGTMAYMPPEKFSADKQIIKAGDIFSLGVTMYELLTGDLPFGDNGGLTLKAGADVPNLPAGFSPELNELLKKCMAKEPWERPIGKELTQNAQNFNSTANWHNLNNKNIIPAPTDKIPDSIQPIYLKFETALEKAIAASEFDAFIKENTREIIDSQKAVFYYMLVKKYGQIELKDFDDALELQKKILKNSKPISLIIPEISLEMILIKGGTFIMGSSNGKDEEKPQHSVTLDSFYIGKTPITQKMWKSVMFYNPSYFKGDNLPVVDIEWEDTQLFITKLNQLSNKIFRLPTEAEWEYAAGGGVCNRTEWAGTDEISILSQYAWYCENSAHLQPVALKEPTKLGLYDMSGNIWEWCNDWHSPNYYEISPNSNPNGPSSGNHHVYRGGSYCSNPAYCRISGRTIIYPNKKNGDLGFRIIFIP